MVKNVQVTVKHCFCEVKYCGHQWLSLAKEPPASCPKCKSREWNGIKRNGRPPGPRDLSNVGLGKPKRVRSIE